MLNYLAAKKSDVTLCECESQQEIILKRISTSIPKECHLRLCEGCLIVIARLLKAKINTI